MGLMENELTLEKLKEIDNLLKNQPSSIVTSIVVTKHCPVGTPMEYPMSFTTPFRPMGFDFITTRRTKTIFINPIDFNKLMSTKEVLQSKPDLLYGIPVIYQDVPLV